MRHRPALTTLVALLLASCADGTPVAENPAAAGRSAAAGYVWG
ncbi:MAG: hypothetical protein SGJ01_17010 [Gemmatimonadota bacterium]|nr:hypothetical protein [Gemmatimonadota bacterium]